MSDGRTNGNCAFCRNDLTRLPVLLDVRRDERELRSCRACYNYLWECEQMHGQEEKRRCAVCSADTEDTGVRFLLCDRCWDDIGMGRRVLMEDGGTRTPPSELLRGDVRS